MRGGCRGAHLALIGAIWCWWSGERDSGRSPLSLLLSGTCPDDVVRVLFYAFIHMYMTGMLTYVDTYTYSLAGSW